MTATVGAGAMVVTDAIEVETVAPGLTVARLPVSTAAVVVAVEAAAAAEAELSDAE